MSGRDQFRMAASGRRAMIAHAQRDAPRECCGFLLGSGRTAWFILPLTNVDPRPHVRYRIDPRAHLEVRRVLRQVTPRLEIVGVYHSHPRGPATPSPSDVAEAHYPEWLYVIIDLSMRRAGVRAFSIRDGGSTPVALVPASQRRGR